MTSHITRMCIRILRIFMYILLFTGYKVSLGAKQSSHSQNNLFEKLPMPEDVYHKEECSLNVAITRDQFEDICPVRELENFRKQLNDAKRKLRSDSVALETRLAEALAKEASARAHAHQEISTLKSQVAQLTQEVSALRQSVHECSQACSRHRLPAAPAPPESVNLTPEQSSFSIPKQSEIDRAKGMQLEGQVDHQKSRPASLPITTAADATDCWGVKRAGVYMIKPSTAIEPFPVYCRDGWTYIANRKDGSVNFLRNWEDYKNGFGDLSGEFYLGNEKVHQLTTQAKYRLRLDATPWNKTQGHATYREFQLSGEGDLYRLHIGSHSGTLRNCLYRNDVSSFNHNKMPFSTFDKDNDNSDSANCAIIYGSGNWFNDCYSSNLFGPLCGPTENHSKCAVWWDEEGRLILHQMSLRIRENRGNKDD